MLVYPRAIAGPQKIRELSQKGNTGAKTGAKVTTEDLQGLREYRDTDPIHHVSWKHYAKGQGLLTRDFSEKAAVSGWLNLSDYLKDDLELALSELTYQVIELSTQDATYGLNLAHHQIMPNSGSEHKEQCLEALANYSLHGRSKANE